MTDGTATDGTGETRGLGAGAKWALGIVLGLLFLVGAVLVGANTDAGRRFLADQINALEIQSGLDIEIADLDGSIYSDLTIRGLVLRDLEGVFFRAPEIRLDWSPFALIGGHVDIRAAIIPEAALVRLPVLRPSEDPDAPLLPDIDIDVDRLEVGRLALGPAITGRRHALTLSGEAHIADGRAELDLNADALTGGGLAGGDRLALIIDAVPEDDRLRIDAQVKAPANGLVASLAGIDSAFRLDLDGEGSWQSWNGSLDAVAGDTQLADLTLRARAGTFRAEGYLRPDAVLAEGTLARLAGARLDVDAAARFENRRADIEARLRSDALVLSLNGIADLGETRFDGLVVEAQFLQPQALSSALRGRDIRLRAALAGPLGSPDIEYELTAAAIGTDDILAAEFRSSGVAKFAEGQLHIPVDAAAPRVTGVSDTVARLLTNLRVEGLLVLDGARLTSEALRIRSDQLDTSLMLFADLATGRYTGALDGRLNDYLVPALGTVDIELDLDLVTLADGSVGVRGPVRAVTDRIDSGAAERLLGGKGVVTGYLRQAPGGIYDVETVALEAPALSSSGRVRYHSDGRIRAQMAGMSDRYGPFTLAARGTLDDPIVRIEAESPTVGIAMSDVVVDITREEDGYLAAFKGQSAYGPVAGEFLIGPDGEIDVRSGGLAGISVSGRLVQSAAGPYTGTLRIGGNGLQGTLTLSDRAGNQAAHLVAQANGTLLEGDPPIAIRVADIDMRALITEDGPRLSGSGKIAGLRYGPLRIAKARIEADTVNGTGRVRLAAEGRTAVDFKIGVNAQLSPGLIRAAIDAEVNGIDIETDDPAVIRIADGIYRLEPVTLKLPSGEVRLAGRYGDGISLQSRIRRVDMSLLNSFMPSAGFGGSLSGSLDWAQPSPQAFPAADLRIDLDNFTRSGTITTSQPVDATLAGKLTADGGDFMGIFRERGRIIGRMKAALTPLSPAAGTWQTRLLDSPLRGGLRYNGPASALFSFAGLPGQSLEGTLAIAVDVTGRVDDPQFSGALHANALTYENDTYGTRLTNLAVDGRFDGETLVLERLAGKAGEGTIAAEGRVGLSAAAGYPTRVDIVLQGAQLASSNNLSARVSGELALRNGANIPASITGSLSIPEARYRIVRSGAVEVPELTGVARRPVALEEVDETVEVAGPTPPDEWDLDIDLAADNRIFVQGMGLESEWEMGLNIGGTTRGVRIGGGLELVRGTFSFAGQRFDLSGNSTITFDRGEEVNPLLDIRATSEVEGVTVFIDITGRAFDPEIDFSSSPARPQEEILSLILFGGSAAELSALEAVQLAAALNNLRGSGGGLNPLGELRRAAGFDRLRVLGNDDQTGRGTAVAVGQYIGDDIYLEIITDTKGFTATQIEIALTRALSILSRVGTANTTSVNLRYSKDY